MKKRWSISKEKLVTAEEGLVDNAEIAFVKPVETSHACKQLIQYAKLILCLKLLLFVGWTCYSIWQTYRIDSMEVKVAYSIREAKLQSLLEQHLTSDGSTNVPTLGNALTGTQNILQAEYVPPKEIWNIDKLYNVETDTAIDTKNNNLPANEYDSVLGMANDEESISPNAEIAAVLQVDIPDSAGMQFDENLKVNESKENTSDQSVSTSALADDFTEKESEEKLTSDRRSSSDEDANYQSNSENTDETLNNSDNNGLTAIDIENPIEIRFYMNGDTSQNSPATLNLGFGSYFSLWDFRRRFMKRNDTSVNDHVDMDMDNEEEKSNDHLAPQLLKEKAQNDIVSRLGHKITRSINNGVSSKGISLNASKEHVEPTSTLYNAIHEKESSVTTDNDHEEELIENDLNKFLRKMETLATHIDRLHERFLRLNELNDDYISKEFSSEY